MTDLRKLAEAATPGPWTWAAFDGHDQPEIAIGNEITLLNATEADAEFIAAANPTATLALLDERDALEKENEALEQFYADAYPRTPGQSLKSNHLTVLKERDALKAEVSHLEDQLGSVSLHVSTLKAEVERLRAGQEPHDGCWGAGCPDCD